MECGGCQRQLLCSACFQERPQRQEFVPPRAFFLTVPYSGHRFGWQGFCKGHRLDCRETPPGSLRASRGDGGCPCQARSQHPQPDAIRRALAACQYWGNLLRRCITPARSATEEEPNQSARSLGRGAGCSGTHLEGGAVNREAKSKRDWPKGDLPRPNHRDGWRQLKGPPRRRV